MLQVAAGLAMEVNHVETVVDQDGSRSITRKQQALGFILCASALNQEQGLSRRQPRRSRTDCRFDGRKGRQNPARWNRLPSVNLVASVNQSKKLR